MQILTVCRIGADWAFRDVTGEAYGHSPHILITVEAAERMALRIGARVSYTSAAEAEYRAAALHLVDMGKPADVNPPRRLRASLAQLVARRRNRDEANR